MGKEDDNLLEQVHYYMDTCKNHESITNDC